MKRINILGCQMDIATMDETVSAIQSSISNNKFIQHVVVNVAKLVQMRSDLQLRESVNYCDIINMDGMGIVLGARFLGHEVKERVAGIDLFYKLLEMSNEQNYPIYLLGGSEKVVMDTVFNVKQIYPNINIAGYHHGYFWDDEQSVVNKIRSSGAKLLFIAVASPKKENFIKKWGSSLGVSFVMGVGGTFDIVAGKIKRAPSWMQKNGLEWLYRLVQEPRRMWRRYLITNTKFAYLLLKERILSWEK